ncbi:MAG: S4 domain-containing protein [Wolinella sp.]
MRIDKFLNTVNIVKRRTIAQDMIENGVVKIAGISVKASRDVRVGDVIEVAYLDGSKYYKVLKIPESKTVPKSAKDEYIAEIDRV